ncbi:MAG: hypothetical protein HY510_07750, partial [Acidobacteria bacterium]|nr:hypothetical protein [Acidobacteriota bacterium]
MNVIGCSTGGGRNGPLTPTGGTPAGWTLAAAVVLAGALATGALACRGDSRQLELSGPTPSTPEALLTELKDHRERIDQATDQMMQRIEAFNATRRPGERTIFFSEIFTDDLSDAQRDVLNAMVAEEKDVSYKSLLEKIISDRDTIRGLQEKVMRLEQALPDRFVLAKKGDTHHDLAINYLANDAHLDAEKAKTVLASVDQTDELLPGNKVWFFYDPEQDAFRTYVTQGEAGQTPLAVRRALQRKLISERDAAQAAVTALEQAKSSLEADISALRRTRAELEARKAELETNKARLEASVDRLSRDLSFQQNSLFYHVASARELKDKGVLTPVLKRVRDVKGVNYDKALDLRQGTTIYLTPGRFGLEHIKDVKMLPPIYQEGRDFTVEQSDVSGTVKVVILDSELFKGK